jgi:hypothetical protein
VTEVDTDPEPVTVIAYMPAGVPFGLVPPPPPLPLEPQPIAMKAIKRAIVASGASAKTRRPPTPQRARTEIPRRIRLPSHRFIYRGLLDTSGTPAVREVVVMTKEAVEFAGTVTATQAAPVGNPEHVSEYELIPVFVIV